VCERGQRQSSTQRSGHGTQMSLHPSFTHPPHRMLRPGRALPRVQDFERVANVQLKVRPSANPFPLRPLSLLPALPDPRSSGIGTHSILTQCATFVQVDRLQHRLAILRGEASDNGEFEDEAEDAGDKDGERDDILVEELQP
jgi:hypothetical protein